MNKKQFEKSQETTGANLQEGKEKLVSNDSQLNTVENVAVEDELMDFISNEVGNFNNISSRGSAFISIVKSENGTRLVINKDTNQKLGYPNEIYIGYKDEYLMLFNAENLNVNKLSVKQNKSKVNIYNTKLVNEVIKHFNLDFSNITSKSFAEGYFENKSRTILYVKLK